MFFAFFIDFTAQISLIAAFVLLKCLLDVWLENQKETASSAAAMTYAGISCALFLLYILLTGYGYFHSRKTGLFIVKAFTGFAVNKVLTLSPSSLSHCKEERILPLLVQDADHLSDRFDAT